MKIFFDTNVVLEFLCGRPHADEVENIIFMAIDKGDTLFVSTGSIYTMT